MERSEVEIVREPLSTNGWTVTMILEKLTMVIAPEARKTIPAKLFPYYFLGLNTFPS